MGVPYQVDRTIDKVLKAGFYWPTILLDAQGYAKMCDNYQQTSNISSQDEKFQNSILVCEIFDVWDIDLMGPFPNTNGIKYILVVEDYVSKCSEAQVLHTMC